MTKIEIPLRRNKLLLGIGGSILFITLGFYLFMTVAYQQTRYRPELVKCLGIAAIVFFSGTGIYGSRKMFDNNIGLIIDNNGITDNTNASSSGLIRWADITEIRTEQVMSTKFLAHLHQRPERNPGKGKRTETQTHGRKYENVWDAIIDNVQYIKV